MIERQDHVVAAIDAIRNELMAPVPRRAWARTGVSELYASKYEPRKNGQINRRMPVQR